METLERIIAEHPFFAGLESYYVGLLVGCASNRRFEAGTYLFKEGEEANEFYLVRAGKIALEVFAPQRKPIIVSTLSETSWAGPGSCHPTSGSSTPGWSRARGPSPSTGSACGPSATRTTISGTSS